MLGKQALNIPSSVLNHHFGLVKPRSQNLAKLMACTQKEVPCLYEERHAQPTGAKTTPTTRS